MRNLLIAIAIVLGLIGLVLILLGQEIGIALVVVGAIGTAFTVGGRAGAA
jgi:hypothetical protein